MNEEIKKFNQKRDAVFRNPTIEIARKYWEDSGFKQDWVRDDVPLAAVHKARLQWLEATDEMIAESMEWLFVHGYENTWQGAPPLTPERRDADRVTLGKLPLRES
jgi:hypothetical protein